MKKKKIEKISILCAFGALIITLGAIPLGSYLGYRNYVDRINNANSSSVNKPSTEIPSDPVLIGIEARLKDGVGFYDNGKANPSKDDFNVVGIYSIGKDKNIEENLSDKQYEMTVPENFNINGGTITFKHGDFTFDFVAKLEKVKPVKLELTSNPYIVTYQEGEQFNKDGVMGNIIYNDGSTKEFNPSWLGIENKNNLTTYDKNVRLSYTIDGTTVYGEIEIKVLSKTEFSNGELIKLTSTGDSYIEDGNSLASVETEVRAVYESNNKILLSNEDLEIANASNIAKFGKEEVLYVNSKSNANAALKINPYISKTIDLTTLGTLKNGKSYTVVDGNITLENNVTYLDGFKDNDVLTFNVNSLNSCKTRIILDVANEYIVKNSDTTYASKDLYLNNVVDLFVNSKDTQISDSVIINGIGKFKNLDKGSNVYQKIVIDNVNLKKGNNNIQIRFKEQERKNYLDASPAFKLKDLKLATKGFKESYQLGEYVLACKNEEYAPNYTIEKYDKLSISSAVGQMIQGSCVIGDYVYYLTVSGGNQNGALVKYNLLTGEKIKESEKISLSNEVNWTAENVGNIAYFNNLIYVTKVDGTLVTINPETFAVDTNPINPFKGISATEKILSMEANKYEQEYMAVIETAGRRYLQFFDRKFEKIADKNITLENVNGYKFQSTYSNDKVIYALYSTNGTHELKIAMYDWNGSKIQDFSIVGGTDSLGVGEVGGQDNLQNMFEYNGDLYIGCLAWGSSKSIIYKVQFDTSMFSVITQLNLGEYLSKCLELGVDAKVNYSSPIFSNHKVNGAYMTQGMCTDGENIYIGYTNGGNKGIYVEKYDLATNKTIATSEVIKCSEKDNWTYQTAGNVCYAEGKILVTTVDQGLVTLNAESLKVEETKLAFKAPGGNEIVTGISYNSIEKKYVVSYSTNKSVIFDASGNLVCELAKGTTDATLQYQSTTSNNNYIYQTFGKDGTYAVTINIFDWTGKFVTSLSMDTKDQENKLGTNQYGSVQCVFEYKEKTYLLVMQWNESTGGFLYQLNFDYTNIPE